MEKSSKKTRKGPTTKIAPHTCTHEYQDKLYGKGNRVWTRGPEQDNGAAKETCTVCGYKR